MRTMDLDGCDTGSNEDERARMAAQLPIQHTAVRCGAEGSALPRGARWLNIACYARQRAVAAALAAPPGQQAKRAQRTGREASNVKSAASGPGWVMKQRGQDLGEVR